MGILCVFGLVALSMVLWMLETLFSLSSCLFLRFYVLLYSPVLFAL